MSLIFKNNWNLINKRDNGAIYIFLNHERFVYLFAVSDALPDVVVRVVHDLVVGQDSCFGQTGRSLRQIVPSYTDVMGHF